MGHRRLVAAGQHLTLWFKCTGLEEQFGFDVHDRAQVLARSKCTACIVLFSDVPSLGVMCEIFFLACKKSLVGQYGGLVGKDDFDESLCTMGYTHPCM